jgi:uncharacterized protein
MQLKKNQEGRTMNTEQTKKSGGVLRLLEELLSKRVLAKLSAEERDELREDIELVRRLLGKQRTPRVAVVGPTEVGLPGLVESLMGQPIEGDPSVKEHLGRGRWYEYASARGALRLLDLRTDADDTEVATRALSREKPDVILFVWQPGDDRLVDFAERVVEQSKGAWGVTPEMVVALAEPHAEPADGGVFDIGGAESRLRRALVASTIPNESFDVVLLRDVEQMVERLVRRAPAEARVKLAHLTWVREVKREVAESVVRAASGIAGAIATVPIPVADIVPLTALQLSMIATVAHIGGHELALKTAWRFATAAGANLGMGLALRTVARTTVRFVPFAGSIVAAGIASSATYAIGRGAIAYFIDDRD